MVGDILALARRYRDEGADELVFYDITASPEGRTVDPRWIEKVAEILDIPFCVAGGIRSVRDAESVLKAGAEKISINSPALADPTLITTLSARFGSQSVVIGIDVRVTEDGPRVWELTGDPDRARDTGRSLLDWIHEVQERGAGEIVLNCMQHDGVRSGYDIDLLNTVRPYCRVPLVASGGAGDIAHFCRLFHETSVDGALAAGVFHEGLVSIPMLKRVLLDQGIEVRP